ncbi:glutamyl-tRNA reductase [Hymenobacter coalescens]
MHPPFKAVSLSHLHAPLALRELLALDELACRRLLRTLRDELELADVLVLSTCNRTEVYYSAPQESSAAIIAALHRICGAAADPRHTAYFNCIAEACAAAQHLFAVAMGLEAQIVGDQQISNQVKRAYQWAADESTAGPFLHRLLHTIFLAHKRVEQETNFRDGAASTSYATLELVNRLTSHLPAPRVLLVGLGEIGADTCRYFAAHHRFADVAVCNRTRARAEVLAQECGVRVLDLADLAHGIEQADVVISAVAGSQPLITRELLASVPVLDYKFLIDLSMPRSIAPAVEEVPGIMLYSLEAVQRSTAAALARRLAAVPQVRAIIDECLADLQSWSDELLVSPTIQKLKNALEQLRQEEVRRHRKKMSAEEMERVDELTRAMMQKVLKKPVLRLKAACQRGETGPLVEMLAALFDLEGHAATAVEPRR